VHWSLDLLVSTASEAVVFSAIGAGISLLSVVAGVAPFVPALGFVLLLEATGLMIIGGALDISTSGSARSTMKQLRVLFGRSVPSEEPPLPAEERKRAQFTAAKYSLTGVLLFLEALFMAVAFY
jgi:hypothetical protein